MKRLLILLLIAAVAVPVSAQKLGNLLKKAEKVVSGGDLNLSNEEVGNGLKEALNEGVKKAVDFLSAEDGYYKSPYKILVPEEARKVTSKLRVVPGFGDAEEKLEKLLNRAAEDAAEKAKPIFVNAIKQMTFRDAMNILMGEQDAATRYLEKTTSEPLFAEFLPVIRQSLDEVNAREYWKTAVTAYNKIPFAKKTNPELDDYVTKKALEGMFGLVEKKEEDIRKNTNSRTTDLMKKVFAKQDD